LGTRRSGESKPEGLPFLAPGSSLDVNPGSKLAREAGKEIEIQYVRLSDKVPRAGQSSPERLLRAEFRKQGNQLPWEDPRKFNPADISEHP